MHDIINIYKADLIQLKPTNVFSYQWRDLFYTKTFYWIDGKFVAIVDYEEKTTEKGFYVIPRIVMIPTNRIKCADVVDVNVIRRRDLQKWLEAQTSFISSDPAEPNRIASDFWYSNMRKIDCL